MATASWPMAKIIESAAQGKKEKTIIGSLHQREPNPRHAGLLALRYHVTPGLWQAPDNRLRLNAMVAVNTCFGLARPRLSERHGESYSDAVIRMAKEQE
jgi:hypothetical protein